MNLNETETIWLSVFYTIVATLVLLVLYYFLNIIFNKINNKISSLKGSKIRSLTFRNFELLTEDRLLGFILWSLSATRIIIILFLLYFYIPLVFSFFPWTENFVPTLLHYVIDPLKKVLFVIINYLPKIFLIFIIMIITKYILRFTKFIFNEISKGSIQINGFYKDWAEPSYKLTRILILAFSLIIIFPYLPGSGSPAFQGISVFLGILFSLGSSSAVANMVS